ncbi:hypothetical protein [Lactiplantibacillus plantarum]|uniref:hypothetical protein n=1 Tax=Lactiplantibacillus plantarum TaxID=1590 RepID=UPI00226F3715|nr:hypothetical protein [Lactiplantibacillus plantarum]
MKRDINSEKPHKLLILGNGYDLYLKYPYTYQQFFAYRYAFLLKKNQKKVKYQKENSDHRKPEIKRFIGNCLALLKQIQDDVSTGSIVEYNAPENQITKTPAKKIMVSEASIKLNTMIEQAIYPYRIESKKTTPTNTLFPY